MGYIVWVVTTGCSLEFAVSSVVGQLLLTKYSDGYAWFPNGDPTCTLVTAILSNVYLSYTLCHGTLLT